MYILRRISLYLIKFTGYALLIILIWVFFMSSLDIYNDFVYDKAILRASPYGYTPLIRDPKLYTSVERNILSGEYVYVVDWLSAYENRIAFAKVKSRIYEGYVNRDLLVEANFNPKPVASILSLSLIFTIIIRKIYFKIKDRKFV